MFPYIPDLVSHFFVRNSVFSAAAGRERPERPATLPVSTPTSRLTKPTCASAAHADAGRLGILAEANPQGINKEHHSVKLPILKGALFPFFGGLKFLQNVVLGSVTGKVCFRIAFHIRKGIAQWIPPPQAELSTIKKR